MKSAPLAFLLFLPLLPGGRCSFAPRCPYQWLPLPGSNLCYRFFNKLKYGWKDAALYCSAQGGELVTVHSQAEKLFIGEHSSANAYHIGLTDEKVENTWLWIDGLPWTQKDSGIIDWNPGEPNDWPGAGGEDCVELQTSTGKMNDLPCTGYTRNFICKRNINQPLYCPWGYTQVGDRCYNLHRGFHYPYSRAVSHCKLHGNTILTVQKPEEAQYIMDAMTSFHTAQAWIGLKSTNGGNFTWVTANGNDTGGVDPTPYWGVGEPNMPNPKASYCVQAWTSDYKWHAVPCTASVSFLCERALLNCAYGWRQSRGSCYQLNGNYASHLPWSDAHDICNQQNSTLLSINSNYENSWLDSRMGRYYWLDYSDKWSDGMLHDGQFRWVDSNKDVWSGYHNFFGNKTGNTAGKPDCGFIDGTNRKAGNGQWHIQDCTKPNYFACKAPVGQTVIPIDQKFKDYHCDDGWMKLGGYCYWIVREEMSWLGAQTWCHNNRSTLASIIHADEEAFLDGQMASEYWIGLNDRLHEGVYYWDDLSRPVKLGTYTNWDVGQPSGGDNNCVGVKLTSDQSGVNVGKWKDEMCGNLKPFVCKRSGSKKPPSQRTTPWPSQCGPYWKYEAVLGYCYRASEDFLTWADADQACIEYGGRLASIHGLAEMTAIKLYASQFYKGAYVVWIGANDLNVEGGWEWSDNTAFNYLNWNAGEPNSYTDAENCVEFYANTGLWNDDDCSKRRPFLCKKWGGNPTTVTAFTRPPTQNPGDVWGCPSGWSGYGSNCYIYFNDLVNQKDGLTKCRTLGGDLVSIHSRDENSFVVTLSTQYNFWIGLSDMSTESIFVWSDASKVDYTAWNTGEPNNAGTGEDCINMYKYNGLWNDMSCSDVQAIMCKKPKSYQPPSSVPPTDSGCPPATVGYKYSCYFFSSTQQNTWSGANGNCQTMATGAQLLTVDDRHEEAFLTAQLASESGNYWIGLTMNSNTGTYRWASGDPLSYTNWDDNFPDPQKGSCVVATTGISAGFWQTATCASVNYFICEIPRGGVSGHTYSTPSTPPPSERCSGSDWTRIGSSCYKAFQANTSDARRNWREARDVCLTMNADLASISDSGTNSDIVRYLTDGAGDPRGYWIGLNDLSGQEGWSNNNPVAYTNWASGQPDHGLHSENHCVVFIASNGGTWSEINCAMSNSWMCSMPVGQPLSSTTQGPSPTPPPQCPSTPVSPDGNLEAPWIYVNKTCYCALGNSWNDLVTWFQAQTSCQKLGGKLASIHSQYEMDTITGLMNRLDYGWWTYWIGLSEMTSTDGSYQWTDGSFLDYEFWGKGEPNDAGQLGEACVESYYYNGQWNDNKCGDVHPAICEYPGTGSTPAPPGPIKGNCLDGWTKTESRCIKVFTDRLNWTTALSNCRAQATKSKRPSLVTIFDLETQLELMSLLGNYQHGIGYWIGFSDADWENNFRWVSQQDITYLHWNYGEPNDYARKEDCVEILANINGRSSGRWNDLSCGANRPYICEMMPDTTLPSPKPPTSQCLGNYTAHGSACYMLTSTSDTWDTLEGNCESGGPFTFLTSITDPFEEAYVRLLMRKKQLSSLWIGMNDRDADQTYEWADGWPALYSRWSAGEPTALEGMGCVTVGKNGRWNDVFCNETHYGLCKYSTAVKPTMQPKTWCQDNLRCPPTKNGIQWVDAGGCYCYYYNTKAKTKQSNAHKNCLQSVTCNSTLKQCGVVELDSNLISIHSGAENAWIVKNILPQLSGNIWIGLLQSKGAGGFFWVDGTGVTYTHWNKGEPNNWKNNEACVELYRNGKWNDIACNNKMPYICKTRKIKRPVTPFQPTYCYGDKKWILFEGSCYYIEENIRNAAPWETAEAACVKMNSHLVSFHSSDEVDFVTNAIAHKSWFYQNSHWTGLTDLADKGDYKWSDGTMMDFSKWNPGEPNDWGGAESCVEMYAKSKGVWNDQHCGESRQYVCKRSFFTGPTTSPSPAPTQTGGCPRGWDSFSLTGKCYRIMGLTKNDKLTWSAAKDMCRSMGKNGDLVSIHSSHERAFILALLPYYPSVSSAWIGLADSKKERNFLWSDQRPFDYSNWNRGEPNGAWHSGGWSDEDCVEMYAWGASTYQMVGKWNDLACARTNSYICELPKDPNLPTLAPPINQNCTTGHYFHYNKACYSLTTTAYTWQEGEAACAKTNGSHLMSINDPFEQAFLQTLLATAKIQDAVWIGLNRLNGDVFQWTDNWPVKYTNWGNAQPTEGSMEKCVRAVGSDGTWDDHICSSPYLVMCKRSSVLPPVKPTSYPGYCPTSPTAKYPFMDAGTTSCYMIVTDQELSFGDAQVQCQKSKAAIASVPTPDDQAFLTDYLEMQGQSNLWIGFIRQTNEGWAWIDGHPVTYTHWGPGEPNNAGGTEDCTEMHTYDGTWNDLTCSRQIGYICRVDKVPMNASHSSTPKTSINPFIPHTVPHGPNEQITPASNTPKMVGAGIGLGVVTGLVFIGVIILFVMQRRSQPANSGRVGVVVASASVSSTPAPSTPSGGFDNKLYE